MNKVFYLLLSITFLFACDKKPQETSIKDEAIEGLDVAEKKIEERKAKGDTLAMASTELEKFLPQSIEGFVMDVKPKGESVNENGMSWSSCEKIYVKGNDRLSIKLADYNGAYGMFAGALAIYAGGASVDNDEEKSESVSIKNEKIKGWQSYKKNTGDAFLIAGIGDRFLLTIEVNNQKNSDLVRSVVEKLDLEDLNKQ